MINREPVTVAILGVWIAFGCNSADSRETSISSGGNLSAGGGSISSGGSVVTATGGTTSETSTGGATSETASGGSTAETASGGSTVETASGGSTAETASGGSTSDTISWTATDYISRKWARWPIPNFVAGLPNQANYTTTTDGVLDNVTGLIWTATPNSATTTWDDAQAYCTSLGDGWSLPTRIELTTIVFHDKSGLRLASPYFSGTGGWTWASTPWIVNDRRGLTGDSALSWFINLSLGDSNNSLSQTAASAYSRCVQVQATMELPAEHYVISNGQVKDNYTGLTWQQDGSGLTPAHTHAQARAYCASLALNGATWRLPALNELASIVDDVPSGDVSPAVDHTAFPNTSPDQEYWSESGYGSPTTDYWTLNFMDGFTHHRDPSTLGNVRCVR